MFEYPAFRFDFLSDDEFNFKHVVSVNEFSDIAQRIRDAIRRKVMIVPGASMGTLTGTTISRKLDDFAWGTVVYPQISKNANRLLEEEGISLLTAEPDIRCRGRLINSHWAIQAEPLALMTEESVRSNHIEHCDRCGRFDLPRQGSRFQGRYEIRRELVPPGQHLITMVETLDVLASAEFIAAVKKHDLGGITFQECGKYV